MAESTGVDQIKAALQLCLTQCQATYQNVTAFPMRFEDDDTGAFRNFNNSKGLASIFAISNVEECVISPNDKMPGLTFKATPNTKTFSDSTTSQTLY
ncbi:hypothetical protein H112_05640 [Trichophyton rubrum D6]|uniref:Uncharacterized protein n=3 Tax=Trichophyton TaxID=5550 RepID=A0A080WK86_TRIRC|nr:uncharacterized protein TERG_11988 [Trichophyton rubrum CBS 118892]EZF16641.1 hypothetical protein H100_05659 [Trichophyton rubrum MR850]EZF40321.1 hypothetical protein H102_05627 [Trichophyton rubrum CBS 100081]EZF50826.1 hypothetical protein H103_05654 [Trichophyton rubrum CBS 288.86]EZF61544.1 hypothetical protein H104_05639 [Trichophyton rubrum CBS 289.86]EZF72307.1 hypothetical protein H105_05667 [Trichophyton soudanense CBS 452.61]EZF82966.1 hypothetical protein H110_05649 [Trichophy